jgi:hypothetical protein
MKKDRLLTGSVGHGGENKPEDVFLLRQLMPVAGGKEIEATNNDLAEGGLADSDFVEEIGGFQEDNGLTVDGVVKPGGETEQNIIAQITGTAADKVSPETVVLNGDVGEGAKNDPEDVANVRRLLASAKQLPLNVAEPPPRFIDTKAVELLRTIQREHGIFDDGRVSQGDETFEILQQQAGSASKNHRPKGEIQVAALPLLIPILLHAARTAGPHIIRALPALGVAVTAQKAIEETLPKKSKRTDVSDPLPSTFPGGPNEPPDPDDGREEFLVHPSAPALDGFPALDPKGPWILFTPDDAERFAELNIVEQRGGEVTRQLNKLIREWVEKYAKPAKAELKHFGGARAVDPETGEIIELKEVFQPNPETGRLGSTFPDISFKNETTGRNLHINTVDTKAKGTQPSLREETAATRMVVNTEDGDIILLIAKPGPGKTISEKDFEEYIVPILRETSKPYDPSKSNPIRRLSPLRKPPTK